jgi:hypothetical protein
MLWARKWPSSRQLVHRHRGLRGPAARRGATAWMAPTPPLHAAALLQLVEHGAVGRLRRVVHVPSDSVAAHPDRQKNLLLLEGYLLGREFTSDLSGYSDIVV